MVAATRSIHTGELVGIHRTFITDDSRKAKRSESDKAKMMLGQAEGTAVMLDDFDAVTTGLFIAEGIENALVARCGGWVPVWALGSAGAVRRFPVLGRIEALLMA